MFAHAVSMIFFFNDTATTEIYTLSLHDALPISGHLEREFAGIGGVEDRALVADHPLLIPVEQRLVEAQHPVLHRARSEEHTSELQSPCNLVCRLLLEKKNKRATAYKRPAGPMPA